MEDIAEKLECKKSFLKRLFSTNEIATSLALL
jgi:hypothetical protein